MQGVRFCCRDRQGKEEVTANCNNADLGLLILKSDAGMAFSEILLVPISRGKIFDF